MKKTYFILFLAAFSILSSCKKDDTDIDLSGEPRGESYNPTTKGTERTYKITTNNASVTATEIMTGSTATFNNEIYYEASQKISNTDFTNYYYEKNGIYKVKSTTIFNQIPLEFEYLHSNAAIGESWLSEISSSGTINGVPARMKGTIKEKNISKAVNGRTFNNVIHTTIELQYDMGSGFETAATYEYYSAKGVGEILVDSNIDYMGLKLTTKTELISFNIK